MERPHMLQQQRKDLTPFPPFPQSCSASSSSTAHGAGGEYVSPHVCSFRSATLPVTQVALTRLQLPWQRPQLQYQQQQKNLKLRWASTAIAIAAFQAVPGLGPSRSQASLQKESVGIGAQLQQECQQQHRHLCQWSLIDCHVTESNSVTESG